MANFQVQKRGNTGIFRHQMEANLFFQEWFDKNNKQNNKETSVFLNGFQFSYKSFSFPFYVSSNPRWIFLCLKFAQKIANRQSGRNGFFIPQMFGPSFFMRGLSTSQKSTANTSHKPF